MLLVVVLLMRGGHLNLLLHLGKLGGLVHLSLQLSLLNLVLLLEVARRRLLHWWLLRLWHVAMGLGRHWGR